jgi:hypothetical protein
MKIMPEQKQLIVLEKIDAIKPTSSFCNRAEARTSELDMEMPP